MSVLMIAVGAADEAGVKGGAVAIGLLDDHETNRLAAGVDGEEMKIAILHFGNADSNGVVDDLDGAGLRARPTVPLGDGVTLTDWTRG